jgi:hypothetical protein
MNEGKILVFTANRFGSDLQYSSFKYSGKKKLTSTERELSIIVFLPERTLF